MLRRTFVLALLSALSARAWALDVPKRTPPKRASFHISNVLTVKVPKGAKTVRTWFAVPQEDAYSIVRNFNVNVDGDYGTEYARDSWDNKVGYVGDLPANHPPLRFLLLIL
jgi:hypothetical protein